MWGENKKRLSKKDTEFKAHGDSGMNLETERKENKYETELRREDIAGIESQMEKERNQEGLKGAQSLTFEGAALARLSKEAPEAGIEKVKMSDTDWKKSKDRLKKDILEAETNKRKDGEKKGWDEERIQREIQSERVWIKEFQKSYLKDIDPERFENDKDMEITDEEWNDMVADLEDRIGKGDWHNVIPRAGHMHNLKPERFGKDILPLFSDKIEEGILGEIELLKKGDPGAEKEGRRKPNPWELASRIRYAVECFPKLRGQIEVGEKDWENMNKHLEDARNKVWGENDKARKGEKGDYWVASYQLCNMKILENMIKRRDIKGE